MQHPLTLTRHAILCQFPSDNMRFMSHNMQCFPPSGPGHIPHKRDDWHEIVMPAVSLVGNVAWATGFSPCMDKHLNMYVYTFFPYCVRSIGASTPTPLVRQQARRTWATIYMCKRQTSQLHHKGIDRRVCHHQNCTAQMHGHSDQGHHRRLDTRRSHKRPTRRKVDRLATP